MVTSERKRLTISISQPTKDVLDHIKHPGQSYEGLIQELIGLWKRNTEWKKRTSTGLGEDSKDKLG